MDTSLKDFGRMRITLKSYGFLKVQSSYFAKYKFHAHICMMRSSGGSNEVLKHYTTGIKSSKTLANKLKRTINLTPNKKVDLITSF